MRTIFLFLILSVVSMCFLQTACGEQGKSAPAEVPAGQASFEEPLPANADSTQITFRDLNFWMDKEAFCVASLIDNQSNDWQRIWVRIELLDSAGRVLTIRGDSSVVVRGYSDAVPPRGATAIFQAFPLVQLSGVPASCRLTGAGATKQSPGAILITGEMSGVRMQYPDPNDPTKIQEKAFKATLAIENPLMMNAEHPKAVFLVYGTDNKLYFAQPVSLDAELPNMKSDRYGPFAPGEKRLLNCLVVYSSMPQKIQEIFVGRVDAQPYDGREN